MRAWDVAFYCDAARAVPAEELLDHCPVEERARLMAIIDAVAEAPPPQFSGAVCLGLLSRRSPVCASPGLPSSAPGTTIT